MGGRLFSLKTLFMFLIPPRTFPNDTWHFMWVISLETVHPECQVLFSEEKDKKDILKMSWYLLQVQKYIRIYHIYCNYLNRQVLQTV